MSALWFFSALLLKSWLVPYGIPESGVVTCSYYGDYFDGRLTANGEIFHQTEMTCASPRLPFGTILTLSTGDRMVTVRVNDRGPYATNSSGYAVFPLRPHPIRHLDLSKYAFIALFGETECGVASAKIVLAIQPRE